jgi:hypothetical protein
MDPIFSFTEPPSSGEPVRYCWCCAGPLTTRGECPICDMAGMMSPPHICRRSGRIISDEHDCQADFTVVAPDHETALRGKKQT